MITAHQVSYHFADVSKMITRKHNFNEKLLFIVSKLEGAGEEI